MNCNYAMQVAMDALEAYCHTGALELAHRIGLDDMEREWISVFVLGEGMQVFSRLPGDASECEPEGYFNEEHLQHLSQLQQAMASRESWHLAVPAVAA